MEYSLFDQNESDPNTLEGVVSEIVNPEGVFIEVVEELVDSDYTKVDESDIDWETL